MSPSAHSELYELWLAYLGLFEYQGASPLVLHGAAVEKAREGRRPSKDFRQEAPFAYANLTRIVNAAIAAEELDLEPVLGPPTPAKQLGVLAAFGGLVAAMLASPPLAMVVARATRLLALAKRKG